MSDLEAALRPYVESGQLPGLVALAAHGDDVRTVVLGDQALGGPPMRRDSIFRAASITKPLTSALTMTLVQDGVLALDQPVGDLVPELASPRVLATPTGALDDTVACERPIIVRHLLTHTAGLGFPAFESPVAEVLSDRLGQGAVGETAVPPAEEWVRRLAEVPLVHQPGDGWTYNLAYDVLGVVLARAAGRDLPTLMAERVLDPLGMADTGFVVGDGDRDRFTTLYSPRADGTLDVLDEPDGMFAVAPGLPSGAGGLVTTADDQEAFYRMLLRGGDDVLDAESVRLVTTDHTTARQRDMAAFFLDGQGYGFGVGVDTEVRDPWHSPGRFGWIGGTGVAAYADPQRDLVTVILTQVSLSGPQAAGVFEALWQAAVT